jgi:hypothetical protein
MGEYYVAQEQSETWTSFQAQPSWYYCRLMDNAEDRLARVSASLD